MNYLNENEKLLINSGLSMVGGVVVGTVQGTYQYLTQGGNVTFGSAVTFAVATFGVLIGVALRAYVPAHAQQMLADAEARAAQLEEALHLATTAQPGIASIPQTTSVAAPTSPVVIHFNGVPMTQPVQLDTSSGAMTLSTTGLTAIQNSGTPIVVPPATNLPGTVVQPATVQLTMAPSAPTIAGTPDLTMEDTAVRKSVNIANTTTV